MTISMRFLVGLFATFFLFTIAHSTERPRNPAHMMVGPGIFNINKEHRRVMIQLEYRWDFHRWRPLASFFITTDRNFFLCGGVGYDIYLFWKKVVITPSFAPGIYYHGDGRHLGFPLNFRSALEVSYVLGNKGRLSLQFNHISNARILWRNPGVNSLILFYAIPIWPSSAKKKINH